MTKQLNGPITSDLPPLFQGVEAVCFDAFGTLVEILDRRRSFTPLFEALLTEKQLELKDRLMREPQAIDDWPKLLDVDVDPIVMFDVNARVAAEVRSIAMRPKMTGIWNQLKKRRFKLALCSNLALPFGAPLRQTLPGTADVEILSYETGMIKPEPSIYAHLLEGLKLAPAKVLFVGDTMAADIEAPRTAGMKSLHINELEEIMCTHAGTRLG